MCYSDHYVRDASGNTMAVYNREQAPSGTQNITEQLSLKEQHLYGSSRLGIRTKESPLKISSFPLPDLNLLGEYAVSGTGDNAFTADYNDSRASRPLGEKKYEFSNYLGNVLATTSDRKLADGNTFLADVTSSSDYYPFGMQIADRSFSSDAYRYGFNGKELDDEGMGGGGSTYDYGFRIYNPGLGKFLSVDPIAIEYPFYSPYHFAGNNPIQFIDLDGLEPSIPEIKWDYSPMLEKKLWGDLPGIELYTAQNTPFSKKMYVAKISDAKYNQWQSDPDDTSISYEYWNADERVWEQFSPASLVDPEQVKQTAAVMILAAPFTIAAIETAPIWMPRAKNLLTLEASGIGFASDAASQTFFNIADGKNPIESYNLVSGLSNTFLKNPFAANYIGSQVNLSIADTGVKSFEGAVANGLIGGSLNKLSGKFTGYITDNFRINISSLKLNDMSSIADPRALSVGVGAHTTSNIMGGTSQKLTDDIVKDEN